MPNDITDFNAVGNGIFIGLFYGKSWSKYDKVIVIQNLGL